MGAPVGLLDLPLQTAFLNPAAMWLQPTGEVLVLARRFDASDRPTWYSHHPDWRAGSIRNFVGDSCLVAAFGRLDLDSGHLSLEAQTVQYADDCDSGDSSVDKLWADRSHIEDARPFVRADGSRQVVYNVPEEGGLHSMYSAPLLVDLQSRRARLDLTRRVALCQNLVRALGEGGLQKNWSPFSYGGRDYLVYQVLPLRVWGVDHDTGACVEASAQTPPAFLEALRVCNGIDHLPDQEAEQRAWRMCTGSRRPFPQFGKRVRHFSLSIGGGSPGVQWAWGRAGSTLAAASAATGVSTGAASTAVYNETREGDSFDEILFAGHSQLYAESPQLLDFVQPAEQTEVGPEAEWHSSYSKLYHTIWYTLRPQVASDGDVRFMLNSMSRLFTPPNSRFQFPKVTYPMALLVTPPSTQRSRPARVILTYGELDVLSQSWAAAREKVAQTLLPPAPFAAALRASSLLLSVRERKAQWGHPDVQMNEFSGVWYHSTLAAAPCTLAGVLQKEPNSSRSCKALGFQMLWNSALLPFPGTPHGRGSSDARCKPLHQQTVLSVQGCCAWCSEQGQRCTAWSYFAPRCYWSSQCQRTIAHHQVMWGAISGFRLKRVPHPQPCAGRDSCESMGYMGSTSDQNKRVNALPPPPPEPVLVKSLISFEKSVRI